MTINREDSGGFRVIGWLWGAVSLVILTLVFCFPHLEYSAKIRFANPFLLALAGLTGLALLYRCLRGREIPRAVPPVLGVLFLVFQIWCVRSYYFVSGWDSGWLFSVGLQSAVSTPDPEIDAYFSWYPNNILLAYCYSKFFAFVFKLGKSPFTAIELTLYFQCLICCATGLVTFKLTEAITHRRDTALWAYFVFLLLVGLSPWVAIEYSDPATLLFPALILWLYISKTDNARLRTVKCFVIGVVGILGFRLKPTAAIPLIAVVCLEIFGACRTRDFKPLLKRALPLLLGCLCAGVVTARAIEAFPFEIDPEKRIGLAHFVAMGLNEKSNGVWAEEDVLFAKSFETVAERDAAEWRRAGERLASMKLGGLLRLYIRKLLTCFHDGTFSWTKEGGFFAIVFDQDTKIAQISRSFYYKDGANFRVFQNFEQAIWLSVLLLSAAAAPAAERETAPLMLTLLGLVLYFLLFEVRARYVYIFAPLYIALAACGAQRAEQLLCRLTRRQAP